MEGFVLLDTGAWSLVPPLLALALALITKEVYSSLLIGIVSGLLIYQFSLAGVGLEQTIDGLCLLPNIFIEQISANAGLILFLALLGALTMLITKAGGSIAYAKWAVKRIKNPRVASIATALLGVIIFVDDYFNCLTVGSVMRPVTDRFKICREKLAWIIDSTAAPICIIAPISSWAAAVGSNLRTTGAFTSDFSAFVSTIPYNFYALLSIVMVAMICLTNSDFGPMRAAEERAAQGNLGEMDGAMENQLHATEKGTLWDMLLPIGSLIVFAVLGLLYDGGYWGKDPAFHTMAAAFGNPVIVSGGIATAADIRALAPIADAVEGVITGRAIYEGTLTVADGVAACDGTFHLSDQLEEEGRPLTIEELES